VVPLPYLLYRVNARFQEEIRGLKDIQGALSPTSPQHQFPPTNTKQSDEKGVATRKVFEALKRPVSPTSSGDEADSSDEEAIKEEEAERVAEEEEALARRLAQLQRMMTNEKLGLVSGIARQKGGKPKDRGRIAPLSTISGGSYRQDALSSASASRSQSVSSASPPHGSILDMPSSPPERSDNTSGQTPRNRSSEPNSPPRVLDRNSLGQRVYARHRPLVDPASDLSSHGSEASSFSDLSGKIVSSRSSKSLTLSSDASISASALEDAFMSNFGSNNNSNLWVLQGRSMSLPYSQHLRQFSLCPK